MLSIAYLLTIQGAFFGVRKAGLSDLLHKLCSVAREWCLLHHLAL